MITYVCVQTLKGIFFNYFFFNMKSKKKIKNDQIVLSFSLTYFIFREVRLEKLRKHENFLLNKPK